jgi:hypothetical protein
MLCGQSRQLKETKGNTASLFSGSLPLAGIKKNLNDIQTALYPKHLTT